MLDCNSRFSSNIGGGPGCIAFPIEEPSMSEADTRREFLNRAAGYGVAAAGIGLAAAAGNAADPPPKVADHTLTVIAGKPRERGRQYGEKFKEDIADFLGREIWKPFVGKPATKEQLLRYAGGCARVVKAYSPIIHDELEGMAEGSGLRIEELVLLNLHEEFQHRGVLPTVEHCTAMAAGPPDTSDGNTYVGQNWDWMPSVYGLSRMLLWKRSEGPSVLAYAYPGLWVGAGLNSAGLALCWTSTEGMGINSPKVGVPAYLLIAHLLYQESLAAVIEEAKRAKHAGWFTFVMADGKGRLVNIEGTPEKIAVEEGKGHMARVYCGSREMTKTPADQPVKFHPQCARMYELLGGGKGKLDRPTLQGFFGDHKSTICKHNGTLDAMLFNCTTKEALVSRGPGCSDRWKAFGFQDQ
jgi:isopenicillin-N N-acyltransferase-like protein